MIGLDRVDSFNFNAHKALRVAFDCSALWVRQRSALIATFETNPEYLRTSVASDVIDYRNWQIPLGRRFRSLKLWFTLRSFGLQRLRQDLRAHVDVAQQLAAMITDDDRFELVYPVYLGLVCLRCRDGEAASRALLARINGAGYFASHSAVAGHFFVRLSISAMDSSDDADRLWAVIAGHTAP
jgi:aromatic-L-amino-acid decarboxylase